MAAPTSPSDGQKGIALAPPPRSDYPSTRAAELGNDSRDLLGSLQPHSLAGQPPTTLRAPKFMIRTTLLLLGLILSVAHAADAPASEASIREILKVTDARKLVDGMFAQM